MWHLHVVSKTYGIRPSELLEIQNEWVAYCLDGAVSYLGIDFENKLNDIDDKGNHRFTIEDLLDESGKTAINYFEKKLKKSPKSFKVVKGKSSV